jgi:hypothetical protein
MDSQTFTCGQPTSLRIDDQPIETVPCPDHLSGAYLDVPLGSPLARRILSAKKVVVEIGGPNGPQMTFDVEGYQIPG